MNILSYKPFAHTESMQDIKLQVHNEYEKIMSQFSMLSPIKQVIQAQCESMFAQTRSGLLMNMKSYLELNKGS